MQQKVKPIVFVILINFLILASCKTPKEAEPTNDGSELFSERIIGIVRNSETCGYYIEVMDGDKVVRYLPENLEVKFKVEGMKLKFGQKPSKMKKDQKCEEFKPVLISDVDAMR